MRNGKCRPHKCYLFNSYMRMHRLRRIAFFYALYGIKLFHWVKNASTMAHA